MSLEEKIPFKFSIENFTAKIYQIMGVPALALKHYTKA